MGAELALSTSGVLSASEAHFADTKILDRKSTSARPGGQWQDPTPTSIGAEFHVLKSERNALRLALEATAYLRSNLAFS